MSSDKYEKNINVVVAGMVIVAEQKAEEYFKKNKERFSFICDLGINLIGNLTIKYGDSTEQKMIIAKMVLESLSDWYERAISEEAFKDN